MARLLHYQNEAHRVIHERREVVLKRPKKKSELGATARERRRRKNSHEISSGSGEVAMQSRSVAERRKRRRFRPKLLFVPVQGRWAGACAR